mmetsp:Transcript_33593/g.96373  ORF Transcript_33593/g.96373 Transcript_33593/m.96373 type:complete len:224 (-) Transcript_33593:118-789(-)
MSSVALPVVVVVVVLVEVAGSAFASDAAYASASALGLASAGAFALASAAALTSACSSAVGSGSLSSSYMHIALPVEQEMSRLSHVVAIDVQACKKWNSWQLHLPEAQAADMQCMKAMEPWHSHTSLKWQEHASAARAKNPDGILSTAEFCKAFACTTTDFGRAGSVEFRKPDGTTCTPTKLFAWLCGDARASNLWAVPQGAATTASAQSSSRWCELRTAINFN